MPQLIPLNNNTAPTIFSITLNNRLYSMRKYWNEYVSRWGLDINTPNGTAIANGLMLVSNVNLLGFSTKLTTDIGQIRAVDLTGGDCQIADNLGTRIQVVYFTPGEFEALPNITQRIRFKPLNYRFDDVFTVANE